MPEKWAKVDPHPTWCKNSVNDPEIVHKVLSLNISIEHRMGVWRGNAYGIDEETGHYCVPRPCMILVRVGAENTLKVTCVLILRATSVLINVVYLLTSRIASQTGEMTG